MINFWQLEIHKILKNNLHSVFIFSVLNSISTNYVAKKYSEIFLVCQCAPDFRISKDWF